MPDILFILLLALVIFGPKKLPEIAREVGKFMLQFRRLSADFKQQFESELLKIEFEEKVKKLPPVPGAPSQSKAAAAAVASDAKAAEAIVPPVTAVLPPIDSATPAELLTAEARVSANS